MPIPSGFTVVPAPCELNIAVDYLTFLFGPPAPGNRYVCLQLPQIPNGPILALVKEVPLLAGTYLLQDIHVRAQNQDVAVNTFHWRWDGAEDPGPTDFEIIESRLNGFWADLVAVRTTMVTAGEYRWYGPADAPPSAWGESIRVVTATGHPGTATSGLPQQVACSLTEITDVRRRWGRFYIPCLAASTLLTSDPAGLFTDTFMTTVVEAAAEHFVQSAENWRLVVFGSPLPTSLEVRDVRVDKVPDVIRRRRYDGGYSVTESLTPEP